MPRTAGRPVEHPAATVELSECNVEFVNMDELSQCTPTTPIAKETIPLITKPRRRWFFFR